MVSHGANDEPLPVKLSFLVRRLQIHGSNGTRLSPLFSAMEELIVELRLFLELLDHEYLTSTVREKKAVITDILLRVQSSKGACVFLLPVSFGLSAVFRPHLSICSVFLNQSIHSSGCHGRLRSVAGTVLASGFTEAEALRS